MNNVYFYLNYFNLTQNSTEFCVQIKTSTISYDHYNGNFRGRWILVITRFFLIWYTESCGVAKEWLSRIFFFFLKTIVCNKNKEKIYQTPSLSLSVWNCKITKIPLSKLKLININIQMCLKNEDRTKDRWIVSLY